MYKSAGKIYIYTSILICEHVFVSHKDWKKIKKNPVKCVNY